MSCKHPAGTSVFCDRCSRALVPFPAAAPDKNYTPVTAAMRPFVEAINEAKRR